MAVKDNEILAGTIGGGAVEHAAMIYGSRCRSIISKEMCRNLCCERKRAQNWVWYAAAAIWCILKAIENFVFLKKQYGKF